METTIPVSVVVIGHPLIQSVTVTWSANTGMVPRALSFTSEGGTADAQLPCENSAIAQIRCQADVNFAIPNWEIVHVNVTQFVHSGGNHIVIDPGQWIRHLDLRFQVVEDNLNDIDSFTQTQVSLVSRRDHLVINLSWQSPRLSHPVKTSCRIAPNQSWQVPYLLFPQEQTELTLSAFGVVQRHLIKMLPQSLRLTHPQLPSRLLRIVLAQNAAVQLLDVAE